MLLRTEQAGLGGRWGNRPQHVDVMRCDTCGEEYQLKHRSVNDKPLTFCSKTCLARSDVMLEQKKSTCVKRYGVPFVSQIASVKQKKHLTRKQNGTYGMSYAEGRFYTFLCDRYGSVAVERQAIVNEWSIDFYVKSTKTWVQFDGVYWHGLMHEYGDLTTGQRIVYDKDRAQDSWFLARGMRLVRITDTELVESETSGDWSKIETKLRANDMIDSDKVEVTAHLIDGPEGHGWYLWEEEYPEEGYFWFGDHRPTLAEVQQVCPDYVIAPPGVPRR